VQQKKYFSPRVMIIVAGFKNNSKERHIFQEFKHGFCEKMKSKKYIYAQKSSQRRTVSIHIFF